MDFSFLFGTSGYPHKVAKLWGLYHLSNRILGSLQGGNMNGSEAPLASMERKISEPQVLCFARVLRKSRLSEPSARLRSLYKNASSLIL